jgi:hypothetical protein
MRLPLSKRDFDIFLSHAHKDRAFVESLESWLTEKAGFSVWYDARELSGGALLATDLQTAIERCRAILLIASGESLDRGWVKAEYNSARDERANEEGFRIVALRLGSANVTNLMRGITWIDVPEGGLDRDTALSVIRAFYPGEKRPNPATARDVYISCSWQQKDGVSARAVCSHLVKQGFRLVGDARDQKGFGAGDRVERIIASCGAFVGIVPFRDTEVANASEKPYKYFIQEMDFAAARGLPSVIVADPRVRRTDGPDSDWLRMETESDKCPNDVSSTLEALWDEWRAPLNPHYIFYAVDLDSDAVRTTSAVRHLLERVTGMPTVLGNEIHDEPLHSAIMEKIRGAFLVLADITDDNINACIEAGMGLAAGTNVEILAQGKPRRPPFMLRSLQMSTYENEVEQMGLVHKIVRPYRRRVINAEL